MCKSAHLRCVPNEKNLTKEEEDEEKYSFYGNSTEFYIF